MKNYTTRNIILLVIDISAILLLVLILISHISNLTAQKDYYESDYYETYVEAIRVNGDPTMVYLGDTLNGEGDLEGYGYYEVYLPVENIGTEYVEANSMAYSFDLNFYDGDREVFSESNDYEYGDLRYEGMEIIPSGAEGILKICISGPVGLDQLTLTVGEEEEETYTVKLVN